MANRRETAPEASEAVRAAVGYLDEEERWVLLQRWLEMETGGGDQAAKRSLRLEVLRSIVCPRVGDREWDGILRAHRAVRWACELRRANDLAVLTARRLSPTVPETFGAASPAENASREH